MIFPMEAMRVDVIAGAGKKRRSKKPFLRPQEKVAEMILASLGPFGEIRSRTVSGLEKPGLADCLLIEGMVKGKHHRVMVANARAASSTSAEGFRRVAALRKTLGADAAFICVRGALGGEALLRCLHLGLIPVEIHSSGKGLKVHLGSATVVRHTSIQSWALSTSDSSDAGNGKSFDEESGELLFQGKSVRHWIGRESARLLRKVERDCILSARYRFKQRVTFRIRKGTFTADAFEIRFACRIRNRVHSLQADLEGLEYRHRLRQAVPAARKSNRKPGPGGLAGLIQNESPLAATVPVKPRLLVYHPVEAPSRPGLPDLSRRILSVSVDIKYS